MPRPNPHLTEWQETLENARSFNSLLLQLRGFGIPIVITIMGGGVAFAGNISVPSIPVPYAHFALLVIAVFLLMVVIIVWRALRKTPKTALTRFEKWEGALLCAVPLLALGVTVALWRRSAFDPRFVVANPGVVGIVLFGLFLLLGLYGIDRCYYYRLLIGAVLHAQRLEGRLGFSLTTAISSETPGDHSRILITTMYWLPALGGLLAVSFLTYSNLWTGQQGLPSPPLMKCLMDLLN